MYTKFKVGDIVTWAPNHPKYDYFKDSYGDISFKVIEIKKVGNRYFYFTNPEWESLIGFATTSHVEEALCRIQAKK
jgi:hypothetical protein